MKRKVVKNTTSTAPKSTFTPSGFGGWLIRCGVLMAAAVITLLMCFCFTEWQEIGCFAAMLLASWEIFYSALKKIRSFPNDCLLFSLAILLCYFSGYLYESVWLGAFVSVALLQRNALHRLSEQDTEFYDSLRHMTARVKEAKRHAFYDVEMLPVGTFIEVFGGEVIPADGVVVNGESNIDYSAWIGKRATVPVAKEQQVYLGGINQSMPITVKITAHGQQSTAQRLRHAAVASFADRTAALVLTEKFCNLWEILSLITALIYGIAAGISVGFSYALEKTAALLLIGVSGGVAFSVFSAAARGVVRLSRYGVIAGSFRKIGALRKISDVVFAKTGTLTAREMQITEIVPHNEVTKEQLLYFAALAEQVSDHLIAKAILQKFGNESLPQPEHQLILPGEGVCAYVKGKRVFAGNDKLMRRAGVDEIPQIRHSIVCYVAVENMYAGCIILKDPIKESAAETVDDLFSLGIHSVDMITADTKDNADAVGTALGMNRVFPELDAKQKIDVLRRQGKYNRKGGKLAYIGDDKTDAAWMKYADISIAMKTVADDLENISADIAVFSDDPIGVRHAFWFSHKLHRMTYLILCCALLIRGLTLVGWIMNILPLWAVAGVIVIGDLICFYLSDLSNRFQKAKHTSKK